MLQQRVFMVQQFMAITPCEAKLAVALAVAPGRPFLGNQMIFVFNSFINSVYYSEEDMKR